MLQRQPLSEPFRTLITTSSQPLSRDSRPLFWLLLAATLLVDAVAVYWLYSDTYRTAADTLLEALSVSQISLLCIWSILGSHRRVLVPLVPFAAAAVVVAAADPLNRLRFADAAAEKGFHVAGIMALLWILKRTPWWQRDISPAARESWRFSLSQLIVVMTFLGVLVAFLGHTDEPPGLWRDTLPPFIYGYVFLAVGAVLVWRWVPNAFLRLLLTIAIAFVVAVKPVVEVREYWLSTLSFYLIQAPFLWMWLELGQIITRPKRAEAAEEQ